MAKNDFQYGGWNCYTLQCGMWLWNRDSGFAQMSAILEFYIWFPFPHITAVDMSFCTSLRNFIQIGPPSAEKNDVMSIFKMAYLYRIALNCLVFEKIAFLHFGVKVQDGGSPPSWILGVQLIGSLKSPCTTFYRSSIETIALNCVVFEKIALFAFWRPTDRQTDKPKDEQMDIIDA